MWCPFPLFPRLQALTLAALTGGSGFGTFFTTQAHPGEAHLSNPVHPLPAISALKGPYMRPSQAPLASSSCQNFVVVGNKGLKSKIPVSAAFLAVQGRLFSGELTQKSPEIRPLHGADVAHLKGAPWLAHKHKHALIGFTPTPTHPPTQAPCTPALAHTSPLDTDFTRNTRATHFTPQHWLLCHMGLY